MDMQQFLHNRSQFPPEELAKYAGRYVAWNPDGTRIVASDEDPLRLDAAIRVAGYDPGETVISYIPPEDVTLLAGQAAGGYEV